MSNDVALIGLGVMGSNLALNIADHGYKIALWNYTSDLVDRFKSENSHPNAEAFYDLKEMLDSLSSPKKILIMVTAGEAVDNTIRTLLPHLSAGDIVVDLGNSNFHDTVRRSRELAVKDLIFFGTGVSGGAEGARKGPAIMPGGEQTAYPQIKSILEDIAAKAEDGSPCCTYIGPDGAGHFVKMVHNGIEYADMQLIAESYLLLKHLGGFENEQLSEVFHFFQNGPLRSYLIRIAGDVICEKDPSGNGHLIDHILDVAGQKGTGKWTAINGFEELTDLSLIDAACNARFTSAEYDHRQELAGKIVKPAVRVWDKDEDILTAVEKTLYLGKIAAYAQGFALYQKASEAYQWNLDLGSIASIFRAGCIIQAEFLSVITDAFRENPGLKNLLDAPFFLSEINDALPYARKVIGSAIQSGIPVPALTSALSYVDAMSTPQVGANLIQGLRDYFGAHTYYTTDGQGPIHHDWLHRGQ